ncbi:uncharacterized protein AKAW2_60458S [Aspergillus luchuensis]|uniref:Uncharacterized protein n=1 Tax=Aspergillus kawachii TaxID=1069201 RepID=A0A7R7X3I1_ASPKA|nr:uncharacterized protein AKAW2_60458S [Aspergillus luchuensis]BCS02194.1 hypothetical protein AKAW2_60458S [Aspergillus luchuensis]BCS13880.1 hypothetical protein ALUC_60436S [Aspergillus luchuensis]
MDFVYLHGNKFAFLRSGRHEAQAKAGEEGIDYPPYAQPDRIDPRWLNRTFRD